MKPKFYFFPFLLLGLGAACGPSVLQMDYRNFAQGWPADQKAVFAVDVSTDQPANLMIYVRNNADYPFSNLFLIARLSSGDSLWACDTLEYAMANPRGQWLGEGFLEVKESKLWWKENFSLPPQPATVEIEHALRYNGDEKATDPLPGVVGVGFAIEAIQNRDE